MGDDFEFVDNLHDGLSHTYFFGSTHRMELSTSRPEVSGKSDLQLNLTSAQKLMQDFTTWQYKAANTVSPAKI